MQLLLSEKIKKEKTAFKIVYNIKFVDFIAIFVVFCVLKTEINILFNLLTRTLTTIDLTLGCN